MWYIILQLSKSVKESIASSLTVIIFTTLRPFINLVRYSKESDNLLVFGRLRYSKRTIRTPWIIQHCSILSKIKMYVTVFFHKEEEDLWLFYDASTNIWKHRKQRCFICGSPYQLVFIFKVEGRGRVRKWVRDAGQEGDIVGRRKEDGHCGKERNFSWLSFSSLPS